MRRRGRGGGRAKKMGRGAESWKRDRAYKRTEEMGGQKGGMVNRETGEIDGERNTRTGEKGPQRRKGRAGKDVR